MGIFFPNLLPVFWVEVAGLALLGLIILFLFRVLRKWHRSSIPPKLVSTVFRMPFLSLLRVLLRTVVSDGLKVYPLWRKSRRRWLSHALTFYGFMGLMLTTTLDSIFNPEAHPLAFANPIKILGNVSGIAILLGVPFMLKVKEQGAVPNLGIADRIFIPTLVLTVVSGFLTEAFSLANIVTPSYFVYILHLALAVLLLGSAPFTRFVHAILAPYLILYDNYRLDLEKKGVVRDYKQELVIKELRPYVEKERS